MSFSNASKDVRRPAAYSTGPPIGAKACANLPFRLFLEVVHQFEDHGGTCALGDGIPSAQNPRRPYVVALQHGGGGKRDQRVNERELVLERLDIGEAFPHECDRLIRTAAPHR